MIHRTRLKEAVHHRRAPCAHEVLEEQGCLPALHQRLGPALTRVVVYRHHRDLQIRHQLLSPFQQITQRSRYRASLRMPVIFGCRPRHEGRPYRLLQPHPDVLLALSGQPLSLDIPLNHVQQPILGLGENGVIDLYTSALSISTIAYVLRNMPSVRKKEIIKDLITIVKVLPVLPEHVNNILESPMKDIEDALQAKSAMEGCCDLIVTRNESDFKEADRPVIGPDELL